MTNPVTMVDGAPRIMTDSETADFQAAQTAGPADVTRQTQLQAAMQMPGLIPVLGIIIDAFTQLNVDVTKFTPAQRQIIATIKANRATLGV